MKFFKLFVLSIGLSLFLSIISLGGNEGTIPTWDSNDVEAMYYVYENGNFAKNEWKYVRENWYYFGQDGISLHSTWAELDGKWYYFDEESIMLHDTTTPDGYYVGSDGAWVTE